MILQLSQSKETRRVSPADVQDYRTFQARYRRQIAATELRMFERFYAARLLLERGLKTYLNPIICDMEEGSEIMVDACGSTGDSLMIVCCEAETMGPSLARILRIVSRAKNAQAMILTPPEIHRGTIEELFPRAFDSGKISLEPLGWFEDHLDTTLQDTLRFIDLLGNETRIRMLMPLFRRSSAKREYRALINPKLVYKNLPLLIQAGLVNEHEGNYQLSELGKTILAEFITFLEKTRKTLDLASRQKEVKYE